MKTVPRRVPGRGAAAIMRVIESRAHLTRLPGLADPVLQFDLSKEIEQLRTKESWQRVTGRSSKTLVKQQDFRIILIIILVLMKANTRIGEHKAEGRISIQTLQGESAFMRRTKNSNFQQAGC
jgi:hypothetical protein